MTAAFEIPAQPMRAPAAVGDVAVSIRGVSRVFDGVTALGNVCLDIRQGEFFSLLGPSGCGKTTLLRIIAGFEPPTGGQLFINGRDVVNEPAYKRRTNMVFQHGALFPHLSVAENVAFGLEMKRIAPDDIRKRVADALEMVRLGGYGHRQINQLSGGQSQRVALARALVNEPEVLLLDEPLSALDLQLRIQMQDELRRLQRQTGATFVFVTHDQGEAIAMSDRLAVMRAGEVLQVGTPRDIYERPSRRFVAEFIGQSNFLAGTVVRTDGSLTVLRCGGGLEFSATSAEQLLPGAEAHMALRYEKVEFGPGKAGWNQVAGDILDEIYLGASIRRRIAIPHGGILVVETPISADDSNLRHGRSVRLSWDPQAARIIRD